jgi:RimJ/RimL family protein N-acetyltransferase
MTTRQSQPLTLPIRTARLSLRGWTEADREPFAAMNADPRVMEHFHSPLDREQSDAMTDRIQKHHDEHGFGLWAVEVPGEASFVGFIGLVNVSFEAHFTPCVEIGWRIARAHWGRGYATEGAQAALSAGFEAVGLAEIVSFTIPANARSRRVMEKLGMIHDPAGDFDNPRIPVGSPIRRHVLYRIHHPGMPRRPLRAPSA